MWARLFLHCSKTHPSITPRSAKFGARCRFRKGAFVQGSCRRVSNHFRIAGLSYVIPASSIGGLRELSHCYDSISEHNDQRCLLAGTFAWQCMQSSARHRGEQADCNKQAYKGGRSCPHITHVCVEAHPGLFQGLLPFGVRAGSVMIASVMGHLNCSGAAASSSSSSWGTFKAGGQCVACVSFSRLHSAEFHPIYTSPPCLPFPCERRQASPSTLFQGASCSSESHRETPLWDPGHAHIVLKIL